VTRPPLPAATVFALTASATDPATAYACATRNASDTPDATTSAAIWRTHDAGRTWQETRLPTPPGTTCTLTPALDGSLVLLSVDDFELDQNEACAHSRYFLSADDGATWRRVQHAASAAAPIGIEDCQLWGTGRHLFMTTLFITNGQGHTLLERSDDGGATWTRADQGLANVPGSWYPTSLDRNGDTLEALVGNTHDVWITHDAEASWRRIGPITQDPTETRAAGYLLTDVGLGRGPLACGCVFALTYSGNPDAIVGRHADVSYDNSHWSPLPPIPVKGTSVLRSGVYDTLGIAVDGKLVVLGADPSAGIIPDVAHPSRGPAPRLWAWNSQTARWELAEARVPCQDLQTCALYAGGSSAVYAADGTLMGTQFWLVGVGEAGESQTPAQTIYRLFIPWA
jgi:photosystem II stability/assembly factor-like uncharacterized protein